MSVKTFTRSELILGTVRGVAVSTDDDTETTYEVNIVDGWTRELTTWDEDGLFSETAPACRASVAVVLRAVAHDDAAREFVVDAHVRFVRALRAAACMGGDRASSLHARAARQAHALTRALAEHGRALADPDVLDPRKDTRPVVAA